jgi:hypothetical protein
MPHVSQAARSAYGKLRYAAHRERLLAAVKKWSAAHRDHIRAYKRRYHAANPGHWREAMLRRNYGLTLDGYHALFERQGERCAICGDVLVPVGPSTCVDHSHKTGRVRGLLCRHCNHGIGQFRENVVALRQAARYLEDAS